jgi:hypothetical protein
MGAVAQSPTALPRFFRIAAVPTAAFLVFAIWWLAGWGGQSTIRVLIIVGGLGFPSVRGSEHGIGRPPSPRPAATGVGVHDRRAGCLDVQ